jgi:hypothetical protein
MRGKHGTAPASPALALAVVVGDHVAAWDDGQASRAGEVAVPLRPGVSERVPASFIETISERPG